MPKTLIEIDTDTQVVVPRVPTEEMRIAGFAANNRTQACSDPDELCPHCGDGFGKRDGCGNAAVAAYVSMVASAPQPEQPAQPIPTAERLPTDDDFDCLGKIWCYFGDIDEWEIVQRDGDGDAYKFSDYWLPTGLTQPPAPGGEE